MDPKKKKDGIMIRSLADLDRFAVEFLARLPAKDDGATIVGLSGDLGSGKTAFVKSVARILGIGEEVTSPTFVIEKRYKIPADERFHTLIHIDAYRLENGDELRPIKFTDTAGGRGHLIFIEWPEQVMDVLPTERPGISFAHIDESTRKITET